MQNQLLQRIDLMLSELLDWRKSTISIERAPGVSIHRQPLIPPMPHHQLVRDDPNICRLHFPGDSTFIVRLIDVRPGLRAGYLLLDHASANYFFSVDNENTFNLLFLFCVYPSQSSVVKERGCDTRATGARHPMFLLLRHHTDVAWASGFNSPRPPLRCIIRTLSSVRWRPANHLGRHT